MATFTPHPGGMAYRIPTFITRADDRTIDIASELGEFKEIALSSFRPYSTTVMYSCIPWDTLVLHGAPTDWTLRSWNGRITRAEYRGMIIYPLTLPGFDESVLQLFELLSEYGIAASSINTMSQNLWRRTLGSRVSFDEAAPRDFMLGPVAMSTGGRKEARRGNYANKFEYDMTAAYPHAMTYPVPRRLLPTIKPNLNDDSIDGIVKAHISIPPMEWGPLPVILDPSTGLHCYGWTPPGRSITVTASLAELRQAQSLGCTIQTISGYCGPIRDSPFDLWYKEIVPRLRSVPGIGGRLGKTIANRLWSSFAINSSVSAIEHRFKASGEMYTRTIAVPDAMRDYRSSTAYVGALIQSRVRVALLVGLNTFQGIVYADTDGIISDQHGGTLPANWRTKRVMRVVEVAGAQAYRYSCPDCLPSPRGHVGPHYSVAGATTLPEKTRLFKQLRHGGFLVTNLGMVLPAQDVTKVGLNEQVENSPEALTLLRSQSPSTTSR